VAAIQPRLVAAADTARGGPWLPSRPICARVSSPPARAKAASGATTFAAKMRHTIALGDAHAGSGSWPAPSANNIAVRAEMVRLARVLWPSWCSGRPVPDDAGLLVRGVLDAIALQHPKADDLLDFCRAENARIEAFCAENDLIGLTDEPLEIQWTRSSCAPSVARC